MKVRLETCRHCNDSSALLPIPDKVMDEMGWRIEDDISIDVGLDGRSLILWKTGSNPGGKRLVVTGVTDKSREIQRVGDEVV
jgi:hypothetical protein